MDTENGESAVDVTEIMRQIRETLVRRRMERGTPAPILPDLGLPSGTGGEGTLDIAAHKALHQASQLAEDIYVDYPIEWRNPILGRAWAIVRRKIHGEVRTYVDAMVARQMAFNVAVVQVLRQVVEHLEHPTVESRIVELTAEIESLRRKVSELEEQIVNKS